MKQHKINFFSVTFLAAFLFFSIGQAFAFKIIPPRLVIDPDVKIQHIFIKNSEKKVAYFRFGWKHLAMTQDGKVLNLDKIGRDKAPNYKAADDLIRFSPRRATLQPGETQRVTFMLRRSPDLEAGEYRSHFFIEREPQTTKSSLENEEKPSSANSSRATVSVDVLVSRAVPIYVLHGETNASLELINATTKPNPNATKPNQPSHMVNFKVEKTGNRSVIGIAHVYCSDSGKDVRLNKSGKVFAVYAEADTQQDSVGFDLKKNNCSNIKLAITGHHDDKLSGQTLAETKLSN